MVENGWAGVPVFPVSVYESPKSYIFLKDGVDSVEKIRQEERSMYVDAIMKDNERGLLWMKCWKPLQWGLMKVEYL